MALNKEQKASIVAQFGGSNGVNTGSTEVQVALLTKHITELTDHCKNNPKDFSSKRGLLRMVCQRISLLKYLKKNSVDSYKALIAELGLRK